MIPAGFIRFHKPPRKCCYVNKELWTAKEYYYFNKSYDRYLLTDDGIKIAEIANPVIMNSHKIGRIDNFRFIITI